MSLTLSRRKFLRNVGLLSAAYQLPFHSALALAQSKTISATTYPGAWETAQRSIVLPVFGKATGGSVNLVPTLAVDAVSKVIASRANPPYDVLLLDEGPYLDALPHDIFEKIPVDKIPNLRDVPTKLQDPRGFGAFISGQIIGIAYNTEKIKKPPTSWNDLLKPEYKGRIGIAGMASTLMTAWMVEIARLNGGSEENLDPAFKFVQKMLPNVSAVVESPGALATLFQQGQIDISIHYNNNVGDLQSKGVPVALAKPDTGWIYIRSCLHIIKNTKNPDLAAAYINAALAPEVQTKMAAAPYFLAPVSSKAAFSPGLQVYAKNTADIASMNVVDWAKLNPLRVGYIDRFNREVKV
ncbi:extracellular solute-binding protein [Caballeronia mineralivorans]|jgi:putative spermidine/putrescine transport system substrate-binding protein|uniref:extracellular solute-binding protein n=1 Tax=Caballeronia mineralivorans TaxID=2010198 RepID=UPI0023F446B9|nr:extracellular solute-binding protein [Caballeronia mineralivorans]MDB5780374.1 transporter substrate-binding protein [Caballeronia mineralivorans]MEA3100854.1 putative spermidine/putrescine transport system substrate-binding protein [Caballeronia mineralivorans]